MSEQLNITPAGMAHLIAMYLQQALQYVQVSRPEVVAALTECEALIKVLETPPPLPPPSPAQNNLKK